MSNIDFTKDLLEILQLNDSFHYFVPFPFVNSNSFVKKDFDDKGIPTLFINLKSTINDLSCPHCGCVDHHESKGTRAIHLKHFSFGSLQVVLVVNYHRYYCKHCRQYFTEDIPFRFDNRMATTPNVQSALFEFKENHSMASISRMHGLGKNTIYRVFKENVVIPSRYYHLSTVISIDEFKATSDKGTYAFNIVDPVTGRTLDILEDRRYSFLRSYFLRFPYSQRKKVKIIIMDLSPAFRSIMRALFPNAQIICDRFHYARLVGQNLVQARLDACLSIGDTPLSKSIKRQSRLFYKYYKDLDNKKSWYDHHLKKHFTCKSYIDCLFELADRKDSNEASEEEKRTAIIIEEFYENYRIYQNLIKLIREDHEDYRKELNKWLDYIFKTQNRYYEVTAKNFRKNWFMAMVHSLSDKTTYIRHGKCYKTSYNNGFIEGMNNKIKVLKRNAHGFRYFENLRKRIFMHLGYSYTFKYNKVENAKGVAIATR